MWNHMTLEISNCLSSVVLMTLLVSLTVSRLSHGYPGATSLRKTGSNQVPMGFMVDWVSWCAIRPYKCESHQLHSKITKNTSGIKAGSWDCSYRLFAVRAPKTWINVYKVKGLCLSTPLIQNTGGTHSLGILKNKKLRQLQPKLKPGDTYEPGPEEITLAISMTSPQNQAWPRTATIHIKQRKITGL